MYRLPGKGRGAMSAALTTSPPEAPGPAPGEVAEPALLRPVRRVLTATVVAADLLTLELEAADVPELSMLVRSRAPRPVPGLVLWPTALPACDWHRGVVLVASARDADAARRVAVHSAATLVSDLLTSERRRLAAEQLASRAVELAGIDPLTGLGNRRTWRRALEDEAARATRYSRCTAVVVIDLDGLKSINDAHGHAVGDAHLRRAAEAVREAARSVDVVCRLGGDEFGVLAPETSQDGATRLVERLRSSLEAAAVHASIGVATDAQGALERTWNAADQDMYRAKKARSAP